MERLEGNFHAMTFGALVLAEQHGMSPAEAGAVLGEYFAESWPDQLTPQYVVEAMNRNWQMFGLATETLEVGDDHVRARRDRLIPNPLAFDEAFATRRLESAASDAYKTVMANILRAIVASDGLEYTERVEGDHVIFTIREAGSAPNRP